MSGQDAINERIKVLSDGNVFGNKKELQKLPELLLENEALQALASATLDKKDVGLLAVTNLRVIFISKPILGGFVELALTPEQIHSIQQETGILSGTLMIGTGEKKPKKFVITSKQGLQKIYAAINELQTAPMQGQAFDGAGLRGAEFIAEIEKLCALKEKGLITDDEFAKAKNKLLDT